MSDEEVGRALARSIEARLEIPDAFSDGDSSGGDGSDAARGDNGSSGVFLLRGAKGILLDSSSRAAAHNAAAKARINTKRKRRGASESDSDSSDDSEAARWKALSACAVTFGNDGSIKANTVIKGEMVNAGAGSTVTASDVTPVKPARDQPSSSESTPERKKDKKDKKDKKEKKEKKSKKDKKDKKDKKKSKKSSHA